MALETPDNDLMLRFVKATTVNEQKLLAKEIETNMPNAWNMTFVTFKKCLGPMLTLEQFVCIVVPLIETDTHCYVLEMFITKPRPDYMECTLVHAIRQKASDDSVVSNEPVFSKTVFVRDDATQMISAFLAVFQDVQLHIPECRQLHGKDALIVFKPVGSSPDSDAHYLCLANLDKVFKSGQHKFDLGVSPVSV